jgi:hypothetical protein
MIRDNTDVLKKCRENVNSKWNISTDVSGHPSSRVHEKLPFLTVQQP